MEVSDDDLRVAGGVRSRPPQSTPYLSNVIRRLVIRDVDPGVHSFFLVVSFAFLSFQFESMNDSRHCANDCVFFSIAEGVLGLDCCFNVGL